MERAQRRRARAVRAGGQAVDAESSGVREDAPRCSELAALERRVRLAAVEELALGPVALYALRQVLCFDDDANVRAAAALRFGGARAQLAAPWLREALDDASASVRDNAWRSLGRLADPAGETVALARRALRDEPVWWVRRSALLTLAALAGFDALDALCGALEDPFWRVRFAAATALGALGDASEAVRATLVERFATRGSSSAAARAAAAFVLARWGHGEGALEGAAPSAWRVDEPVWNADPAVAAARLAALPSLRGLAPTALTEFLAEAHEALRERAVRLLARSGDEAALRASLRWLEQPRLPHAGAAVYALLSRVGPAAAPLAREALDDEAARRAPGAAAWAARWATEHGDGTLLAPLRRRCGDGAPAVRRAAVVALGVLGGGAETIAALEARLGDEDEHVRDAAAAALALRGEGDRALRARAYGQWSARVRCALLEAAARAGARATLALGVADAHPWARAKALEGLGRAGALDDAARGAALRDEDPWVRCAALRAEGSHFDEWIAALGDEDPWVRRVALRCLLRARAVVPREARVRAVRVAAASDDPELRADAAALLRVHPGRVPPERIDASEPGAWGALCALYADPHPLVRAAAAARLERAGAAADEALTAWLEGSEGLAAPPAVRRAAHTWLVRRFDDAALRRVLAALEGAVEPPATRAHLAGVLHGFSAGQRARYPQCEALLAPVALEATRPWQRPAADPAVQRRALGATGLRVAPLALSGVYDLAPAMYEHARARGVNTFFWEPRYRQLTRFLAGAGAVRDDLVVVAGSFHGDAPSIERDVHTALRRLRTDRIDVFLLYWARSPERLTDETFACLEGLKRRGLVRAHGFSTHFRDLAIDALDRHPWDVVMTRHSAAHPGAEQALFAHAQRRRAGVLTFSALCYGRMLRAPLGAGEGAFVPTAADCYRYSASREGVATVIAAPRRFRELVQNLSVLAQPSLDEPRLAQLRAHGALVRRDNQRFNALLRSPPTERSPREAVLALLDDTLGEAATIEHWG